MTATAVPVTTWAGCYADSWQDLIIPESFAHPAKAARGLSHRIYRHLLDSGYVRPGMVVLDPFAGIGGFCLDAMTYGLHYVGVELEPRFVTLGQQNLDLWRQRYGFRGGTIVQGDSRNLRSVLGAQVQCVVGSPPFGPLETQDTPFFREHRAAMGRDPYAPGGTPRDFGTTPGQLGAMPPGVLISSPPYAGAGEVLGTHNGIDWSKAQEGGKVATPARQASGEGYGTSAGQLGAMPPGVAYIVKTDLASNKNHDRINHTVLSDSKEDACQPVKTAELLSHVEVDGVSHAVESTLAQRSKDARSQQDMEPGLPLLATTSPCRTVGASRTHNGQAGDLPGEAMHGTSSGALPLSVTSSPACNAVALSACKSITSSIKTRQAASGIMNSITWKRSVQDVTLGTTEGRSSWRVVPFVEPVPRELPARSAAQMPVGLKLEDVPPGNTTACTPKPSCVSPVALPCHTEANGTSSALMPVGEPQRMPVVEQSEPNTFWEASAQIMTELAALLPSGAVCAWVVKAYVKNKQIVPFPDQWRALCEAHGFRLVEEIHASLVEDHGTQGMLFGTLGDLVDAMTQDATEHTPAGAFMGTRIRTERKSFFRRLAEKKGSPRIDHETVLIMRKAGSGGGVCCVSSPPYVESLHGKETTIDPARLERLEKAGYTQRRDHGFLRSQHSRTQSGDYGTTPGNLGNLPVGRR